MRQSLWCGRETPWVGFPHAARGQYPPPGKLKALQYKFVCPVQQKGFSMTNQASRWEACLPTNAAAGTFARAGLDALYPSHTLPRNRTQSIQRTRDHNLTCTRVRTHSPAS